jgi:tRNA (guanine-N7-)-methyltransferase
MRQFPTAFESQKEMTFYPARPDRITGDILAIGPGRGDFLLSMAAQCPDKQCVAVELSKKRYYKLIPRIEKRGLTNILLINGNAGLIIPEMIDPDMFEKIFVLFPDPWPKRRHIPHRLMSISFMTHLARILQPGGDLYTATDFWSYADWMTDNFRQVPTLQSRGAPYFTGMAQIPYYLPTFYEQKWRGIGLAIYYMHYSKMTMGIRSV